MADFWSHVDKAGPLPPKRPDLGPCWIWTAAIDKQTGYGKVGDGDRVDAAHRVAWRLLVGPIPAKHDVHHACEVEACVNVLAHCETLTRREHILRHRPLATHCLRGHELSGTNLYVRPDRGSAECRACRKVAKRRHYEENR